MLCYLSIFAGLASAEEDHRPPICFEGGNIISPGISVELSDMNHIPFMYFSRAGQIGCLTGKQLAKYCPNPQARCLLNADTHTPQDIEGLGIINIDIPTNTISSIQTIPGTMHMIEKNPNVIIFTQIVNK